MVWISLGIVLAGMAGVIFSARTRSAQLARIARANNSVFHKRKTSITTQLTAGRLEFFTQFFHQYRNVFTYTDRLAFIRLADDIIYLNDQPKTKPIPVTVFTAELKKRQFPILKVATLQSPFAPSQYALMKTNIPAIDSQYRIHAPSAAAGVLFTPLITGILKTRPRIYLELNENALVYHEHTLVPVAEMETFRFRAMQILGELEVLMEKLDRANPDTATFVAPADDTDLFDKQAADMLRFAAGGNNASQPQATPSSFRAVWAFILVLLLIGISFLSWFALHNWIRP